MPLKPLSFANAVTAVSLVAYVLCALISYAAPGFLVGIASSWVHSLNLEPLRAGAQMSPGTLVWGFITFGVFSWLFSYAVAYSYNVFIKK